MNPDHDDLLKRSDDRSQSATVRVYRSSEEETKEERHRCAKMTVEQRLAELAHLRKVAYGTRVHEPLQRVATWQRFHTPTS